MLHVHIGGPDCRLTRHTLRELVDGQVKIGESQYSLSEASEGDVGVVELSLPLRTLRTGQLFSVDEDGNGALENTLRCTFHAQQMPDDKGWVVKMSISDVQYCHCKGCNTVIVKGAVLSLVSA